MITKIEFESENAFSVLAAGASPKDSLLIRKITGLGPPDRDLFIGDYSRDGGIYQGNRVGSRNVVITMDLNPNPALGETVSSLRESLYKAFNDPWSTADHVKINLYDDLGRVRYLVGYTEKFEPSLFEVDTMCQISLICPDPFIRDNTETVLLDSQGWTTVPFEYKGTARSGFYAEIKITTDTTTLTLENNGQKMVVGRAFTVGDIVKISTVRGSRFMTMHSPNGFKESLIAYLTPTSPWLDLSSQANSMKVYGLTTSNVVASITQLRYYTAYWGI